MITIIKTYQIKTSCKSKVVFDVVDLFHSTFDTMTVIYDDKLPEDYAKKFITIFTTTSVAQFNALFDKLLTNLISMELQASINMPMLSTGVYLKNNMKTVNCVLKYTCTVYNDFSQKKSEINVLMRHLNNPAYSPLILLIQYLRIIFASIVERKKIITFKRTTPVQLI